MKEYLVTLSKDEMKVILKSGEELSGNVVHIKCCQSVSEDLVLRYMQTEQGSYVLSQRLDDVDGLCFKYVHEDLLKTLGLSILNLAPPDWKGEDETELASLLNLTFKCME